MFCCCQRRFFFLQPAVPERWILLSAVKTQDPESSQSSLRLATDDLYLIPVFLCICTALVSSLLLCHPLCLPVSAYLQFIRGFLSSFTSPPPSHPIPPRHSRNLSAHLLVIPSLFCRETNLPLPLSSDSFQTDPSHPPLLLLLPAAPLAPRCTSMPKFPSLFIPLSLPEKKLRPAPSH